MKNLMKEAHQLTKEIKTEYPTVDYKAQLGICISYLSNNEGEVKMEDERIIKIEKLAEESKNYNKVWNIVESYSKEIRGRKFNNSEISEFKYKATNIVKLAKEILAEEIKVEKQENISHETKKLQAPKGYIYAKYDGFDAETGERFYVGDLIKFVNGGWIKADNY